MSFYMSFYAKYALPHLIDLAMRNKDAARFRAEWVTSGPW